jgi:hypothetical protein
MMLMHFEAARAVQFQRPLNTMDERVRMLGLLPEGDWN